MTDVFLSYAREDRARIERLAAALAAEGFSVWWDRDIAGGAEFTSETEARLNEAKTVLVAWSAASVVSTWVCDEATVGREKGTLVPISIDATLPRLGFRSFQTIDLGAWHGDRAATELQDLVRVLKGRVSGEAASPPARRAPPTLVARLRKHRISLGAAAIAAVVIAAGVIFLRPQATPGATAPTAEAPLAPEAVKAEGVGLAVLPFTNLSSDPEQEHFADGLTEELLNWLGNVEGLRVPGRTSSFQFKGKSEDLRAIGERLAVDYLLEGSVRRSGDDLRITAQLIEAKTGFHLWSETYDRELADIFAIQDEVARIVVTELLGKIPETGAANPAAVGDVDPRAHALFLEGRAQWVAGGGVWKPAFEKFRAAIEVDPRHALAHAYLAVVGADAIGGGVSFPGFEQNRKALVTRALAEAVKLKPEAADVLFAQGRVAEMLGRKAGGPITNSAIVDFYERAVRANPRHVEALFFLAEAEPSLEKAIDLVERILEIDPAHGNARSNLVVALIASGDRAEAGEVARQSLTLAPDARWPPAVAGIQLGDLALVGEALFADWDMTDRVSYQSWLCALTLANLGAVEEARFLLARTGEAEHPPFNQLARLNAAILAGDREAELRIAEEGRQIHSPSNWPAAGLAHALIRTGEPERAYDILLARQPVLAEGKVDTSTEWDEASGIEFFFTAAHALELAGRRAEARALWRSALAAVEARPAVMWGDHLYRALLHGNLGDRAAAIRSFQAAYDAGFRYLWAWSSDCDICVHAGFYDAHGLFAELLKIPEAAAIVKKIEAENAETLADFNKKYGVLDRVHEMMAAEAAAE